ncbi:MAG TPA: AzlC family ABC transporter permease [Jatrophihabitantaceae bacterium]
MLEESRRGVVRDSLGVGIAVGAYGVAFGAASVAGGLSVLQTSLLPLLAFTGGTQFAVVGVVTGGGTLGAALGSGLLLGARNTLYAMRLAPLLQVRGLRRVVAAHGTIDETTAMAVARRDPALARLAFWWTFAGIYVVWNATTLAGAAGAQALGDPERFGLDAVIPAAFLALLAPRLRAGDERSREEPRRPRRGRAEGACGSAIAPEAKRVVRARIRFRRGKPVERRIAVGAAIIALVLIPFTPPGVPVLAAAAALLLAGWFR